MSIGRRIAVALCAAMWAVAGIARADIRPSPLPSDGQATAFVGFEPPARERYPVLAQWSSLPPEQRQQMRQQMREHWQQMPPEQREQRRQEYQERRQQTPVEERQRIREEMRERGGYGEGRHRGHSDRR